MLVFYMMYMICTHARAVTCTHTHAHAVHDTVCTVHMHACMVHDVYTSLNVHVAYTLYVHKLV